MPDIAGGGVKSGRRRLDAAGRIVIPAVFWKALGIKPGDGVGIIMEEDGIKLMTMSQLGEWARMRLQLPLDRSLVDEWLRERREEAPRE